MAQHCCRMSHQDIDIQRHKLPGHELKPFRGLVLKTMFELDAATLDIPLSGKAFAQTLVIRSFLLGAARTPTRGIFPACCASATCRQAAADPAIPAMKSRRRIGSAKVQDYAGNDAITAGIDRLRNGFNVSLRCKNPEPLRAFRPSPVYPPKADVEATWRDVH